VATRLKPAETAERAGVPAAYVEDLVRLGILHPDDAGELTATDVRRVVLMRSVEQAGLPLERVAEGFERGILTLDFMDQPEYERLVGLTTETFQAAADRSGVPLPLLYLIREATGFSSARPDDLLREDELEVIPFLELQVRLGFDQVAVERLLRAVADSTRRIAEAQAEWWRSQVTQPGLDAGEVGDVISRTDLSADLNRTSDSALMAIYRAQQSQTWTSNIVSAFTQILATAGLHRGPERPPAICFLDITGYTRLTQERGDAAAAELADNLARLVKRSSLAHGGRPVKWLGDGVMCYFRDPGPAVLAALEMVDGIRDAGLPPAHVGVHTGPVVIQEGDYYGQTVNLAARIADYARPGEVLVSRPVVDAAKDVAVNFLDIGAVELKGVSGTVDLFIVAAT
jgi:adenylate cyclase